MRRWYLAAVIFLMLLCPQAQAAQKLALVIGNGKYENTVALPNPANDADDMAAMLKDLGFEVVQGNDLTRAGMEAAIREFASKADRADVVLFFYAGHGLQVDGVNYLVPVDAKLADRTALEFETITLDKVLGFMSQPGKIALAFIDACRNNPLARSFSVSLGKSRSTAVRAGLAPTNSNDSGLFIAYSTAPGDVASDGDGRNSPFTHALLKHLPTPSIDIQQVMTRVKAEVKEETHGEQRPWHNSDLTVEVFLGKEQATDAKPAVAEPLRKPEVKPVEKESEIASVDPARVTTPDIIVELPARIDVEPAVLRTGSPSDLARVCRQLAAVLDYEIVDLDPEFQKGVSALTIAKVCAAASLKNPDDGSLGLLSARSYSNIGDDTAYLSALRRSVALGVARAKLSLGANMMARYKGKALYLPREAERLFIEADAQGDIYAAEYLSRLYDDQHAGLADSAKAAFWRQKYVDAVKADAASGRPAAKGLLGQLLLGRNEGWPKDLDAAARLLQEAAAAGHLVSQLMLPYVYRQQEDMTKFSEARKEATPKLELLLSRGAFQATQYLQYLYDSTTDERDKEQYLQILQRSVALGDTMSLWRLSNLYNASDFRKKSPEMAKRYALEYVRQKKGCALDITPYANDIPADIPALDTPEKIAACILEFKWRYSTTIHDYEIEQIAAAAPEIRRGIQNILAREGVFHGTVDGNIGEDTVAALKDYLK